MRKARMAQKRGGTRILGAGRRNPPDAVKVDSAAATRKLIAGAEWEARGNRAARRAARKRG